SIMPFRRRAGVCGSRGFDPDQASKPAPQPPRLRFCWKVRENMVVWPHPARIGQYPGAREQEEMMAATFFDEVEGQIPHAGSGSEEDLAYRVYDPDRVVLGARMEDQLRIAVCYWHSFGWPGSDVFGEGTFERPWIGDDSLDAARTKMDAAFEF